MPVFTNSIVRANKSQVNDILAAGIGKRFPRACMQFESIEVATWRVSVKKQIAATNYREFFNQFATIRVLRGNGKDFAYTL